MLRYLDFDWSEGADGVITLDAMASTTAAQHAEVLAEADAVLGWCRSAFPHSEGPVEDGFDWDHELQRTTEAGGWCTLTLTLTGSARFVAAFQAAFSSAAD
ncbi:MAG: hypothetical protein EKK52_17380 [Burkholderiales bacterium]|nr:MAG: hypothetical protein EKK52_17380 [Burkholderiales bacterium]